MNDFKSWLILANCLIILYLVYRYAIKPYRKFLYYKKIISQNYHTLVQPYSLITPAFAKKSRKDLLLHKDSHYTVKTIYPSY